jgi:ketosteroid isomerase-like protein
MRPLVVLLIAVAASALALAADTKQDEQEIRADIKKFDAGDSSLLMDDAIVVSGALVRPVVGRGDKPVLTKTSQDAGQRKNQHADTTVVRIVFSNGGDMAYEYDNFKLQFDDNRGHREFPGSTLRVWRKLNGKWMVAAWFARPNTE